MLRARRAEQLARERPGEPRACRRRAARGRGTRAPGPRRAPRRAGASPRLLGQAVEPAHAGSLTRLSLARARRPAVAPSSDDVPLRERGRRARGSRRRRGGRSSASSRSIRSGSPVAAPRDAVRVEQQHERRSGSEPARRRRVQLAHGLDPEPARDALVGERRVDVAVADDPRAALERRPDHALGELGARGREQRRLGPGRHLGPVEQQLADPLAERRAAGLAHRDDLVPLRRAAHSASSAACVVLPEPSMPSNVTNIAAPTIRPHAGGRHRWCRVHRLEPRRPRSSRAATRSSPSTTSRPASARTSTPAATFVERDIRDGLDARRRRRRLPPRRAGRRADLGRAARPRRRGQRRRHGAGARGGAARRARRSSSRRPAARSTASATARRPRTRRSRRSRRTGSPSSAPSSTSPAGTASTGRATSCSGSATSSGRGRSRASRAASSRSSSSGWRAASRRRSSATAARRATSSSSATSSTRCSPRPATTAASSTSAPAARRACSSCTARAPRSPGSDAEPSLRAAAARRRAPLGARRLARRARARLARGRRRSTTGCARPGSGSTAVARRTRPEPGEIARWRGRPAVSPQELDPPVAHGDARRQHRRRGRARAAARRRRAAAREAALARGPAPRRGDRVAPAKQTKHAARRPRRRSSDSRVAAAPKLTRAQTSVIVLNGNGRQGAAAAGAARLHALGYAIAGTGERPPAGLRRDRRHVPPRLPRRGPAPRARPEGEGRRPARRAPAVRAAGRPARDRHRLVALDRGLSRRRCRS